MRLAHTLVLAAAGLAQVTAAGQVQTAPAERVQTLEPVHVASHPERWTGDYAAAVEDLFTRLEADPASPLAATAWAELGDLANLGDITVDPARIAAILARTEDALAYLRAGQHLVNAARRSRFSAEPFQIQGDVWAHAVTSWAVLGPYGPLDHPAPLHQAQAEDAPELGLRAQVLGSAGVELTWRALTRPRGQLFVMPARGMPHSGEGLLYLHARPRLAGDALLEVLLPGEGQVWWNGALVLDLAARGPGQNETRFLAPVAGAGPNELLVRLENRLGARIAARLIDPLTGHALAIEEDAPDPEAARPTFRAPAVSVPEDPAPAEGLARAAWAAERIARGRADQALALAPPEESSEVVRDAWLRMRFEALVAANHLPPEVERRALLEVEANMAAAERVLPEVLAQRVLRLSAEDKPVEALAALDALEAATPTNTNFAALRAVLFAQLDSTGILALNELRRLRETFPTSGRLAALYAQRLEQFEDPVGALRHWVHALTLAGDDQDVQQQALSAMASAGGAPLKVALGMLDLWLLEDPDLRRPRELLEMVLRQAGMDRELNLLLEEEYARAAPDDLAPNAALANFHIARGSFERAREVLRERVAADPGAHSARATLSRLGEPHPAERFFHAFGPDRQEAIDAARGPQDSSIAEALDSGLVYLYPDGSSHERYHTISMALDRKGTELLHTEPVAEHARLAQVLKQDGRILEPSEVNREWVMPFLEPGDAVELVWDQFTRGRRGSAPQIGWWRFASFEKPFVRSRYVLYVPDGLQGELRPFQFDGEYEAFRFDGGTVHVFLVKDRPRQEQEPMLPSFEEILPWVQYGGDLPIDYIEASWRDRLHVLAHVPADLRTELTEVARSVSGTDLERAKALFDAVTAHVLDFRGAAHAAQVWPSKRGNPIFLLGALYELAGIEFEWAVLEEAIAPELNPQPKQAFEDLRGYQVPALRVKGDPPVWVLAPSGRGETFASIPDDMAGAPVLVLAEDGARVEPLPRQQLDDSWDLDLSVAYDVAANGDASVSGTIRITAANGAVMREELSQVSAVQRGGAARQIAGQVVPGLNLAGFDFPDLGTRGAPFMMTFTGSVPQFAREQAGRFRAGLPIRPTGLATGLGAADRRWPMALRFSQRQRLEVTVRGEGWRVTDGPRPFEEQRDGFVHTLETGDDAGGWRALRIFIIRGPVLAPDEVAGFLTREAELERETTRALELERTD